jgi:curved DNA-binding protein CbpA
MTDYFALLQQPRRPWLHADELKEAFHARAREAHPDAAANTGDAGAFVKLNDAYLTLQDPKRRLQHLLELCGHPPARQPGSIPAEIAALFPVIAALTQRIDAVVEQVTNATSVLSRSVLKHQFAQITEQLDAATASLSALYDDAVTRLQEIDRAWTKSGPQQLDELQQLYLAFSYLTRWRSELDERRLQIATC